MMMMMMMIMIKMMMVVVVVVVIMMMTMMMITVIVNLMIRTLIKKNMFIWRWLRIYDDHEILGLFIMAKVNACIWLAFELLFAGLIHSDSKPWASHGHVWPPNLQQWWISALPFHTFMGVMIYQEVLFLAGEPFFCMACYMPLLLFKFKTT